jgi:hypothetical protein
MSDAKNQPVLPPWISVPSCILRLGEKLKQWSDIRSEYSERRSQFVHVEDVKRKIGRTYSREIPINNSSRFWEK